MTESNQSIKPQDVFTADQIAAIKALTEGNEGIKLGILRLPAVKALTGLGTTAVWDLSRNDPGFPKPIKLTSKSTGWRADELYKWLADRPRVQFKGTAQI